MIPIKLMIIFLILHTMINDIFVHSVCPERYGEILLNLNYLKFDNTMFFYLNLLSTITNSTTNDY